MTPVAANDGCSRSAHGSPSQNAGMAPGTAEHASPHRQGQTDEESTVYAVDVDAPALDGGLPLDCVDAARASGADPAPVEDDGDDDGAGEREQRIAAGEVDE